MTDSSNQTPETGKEESPFAKAGEGGGFVRDAKERAGTLAEFKDFLMERKLYWMAPIVIVLLAIGFLLVMTQGTAVAPFIYTIF
ncbi:MAG: hypothetical protein KIT79_12025 [Deltaproteobacteria bacterium]|nr:hypothetical protein [Deltaproteobacteria bacterium]